MASFSPRPFQEGQRIGIISFTDKLSKKEVTRVRNTFRRLGLPLKMGESCLTPRKLVKKDDRFRANEFHSFLESPEIGAIVFAKGGEGSERMIPFLDSVLIKTSQKIILGYSDLTSVLLHCVQEGKSTCFYGRMACDGYPGLSKINLNRLLKGEMRALNLQGYPLIRPGEAEGVLQGGCLSILSKMVEQGYRFKWKDDTILFIEDLRESIESLDHCLGVLDEKGYLKKVKALILGQMIFCGRYNGALFESLPLIEKYFLHRSIPIISGVPCGHGDNHLFLSLGAKVHLRLGPPFSELRFLI